MERNHRIEQLFDEYLEGTIAPADYVELMAYFGIDGNSEHARELLHRAMATRTPDPLIEQSRVDRIAAAARERIARRMQPRRLTNWLPYAAAILLVASVIGYFTVHSRRSSADWLAKTEVQPGGNKATLMLADGRLVTLDEAQTGIVVGTESITYVDGSEIPLSPLRSEAESNLGGSGSKWRLDEIEQLVLSTPKGGTYQVTLPDGSKVWLNSASTLRYPTRFSGDSREVILEGEGYFDIVALQGARNMHVPFNVQTAGQTVEVLGTEFNISAYSDNAETKTTLVEGKVQIHNLQAKIVNQLLPGQQSIVRGAITETKHTDVDQYIAWRQGLFVFDRTPVKDVLLNLSRWYDVAVDTVGLPNKRLNGRLGRDVPLSEVLSLIEAGSELKFEVIGRSGQSAERRVRLMR